MRLKYKPEELWWLIYSSAVFGWTSAMLALAIGDSVPNWLFLITFGLIVIEIAWRLRLDP